MVAFGQFEEKAVVSGFGDHEFVVELTQVIVVDVEGKQAEALAAARFDQGTDQQFFQQAVFAAAAFAHIVAQGVDVFVFALTP